LDLGAFGVTGDKLHSDLNSKERKMAQNFHDWMRTKTQKVVRYAGILAALKVTVDYVFPFWQSLMSHIPKPLQPVMSEVINIVLLILIGGLFVWRRPLLNSTHRQASAAVTQFHVAWKVFWSIFLVMYINGTYMDYYFHSSPNDVLKDVPGWLWRRFIDNALSNLTLFALFIAYVISAGYQIRKYLFMGVGGWLALSLLEIIFIVNSPSMGDSQSLFASLIWQMFLGGIAGTVLALFVGRLESRVMNPPLWLIFALYFYAALQPIYQAIQATDPIVEANHYVQFKAMLDIAETAISVTAAILKIALFALIYWLLDTGTMLFYCEWLHKHSLEHGGIKVERERFLTSLHQSST
jgi:hypothetical protein